MIVGYCFTNLDEYSREKWPEVFVAVPRVGERVEAESGKCLEVVRVTHKVRMTSRDSGRRTPCVEVELHRRGTHTPEPR